MKRIAVVLCGQARFLEQGAWWFKNRVFPESDELQVDYYCYFWGDNENNLEERIKNTHNPVKYGIGDYNLSFHAHRHAIRMGNKNATYENIPNLIQNTICYRPEEFNTFEYNFPGMYLCSAEAFRMIGEETLAKYDMVIRTRSDICLEPIANRFWKTMIHELENNTIHCPWIDINNGIPFVGDLAFFGKPDTMYKHFSELDSNLVKMATINKYLFNEYQLVDPRNDGLPLGHVIWTRASLYTKINWRRLFWHSNQLHGLKTSLIRRNHSIEELEKLSYIDIENIYKEEEKQRHNL